MAICSRSKKPAEQNASTAEQVDGALAITGAHIITSPIKVVETVSKTGSNTSKTLVEKIEYHK